MGLDIPMPWSKRSPQEVGRKVEKGLASKRGAKLHPNSGAGKIKYDASSQEELIEIKNAKVSYGLNGNYIRALHTAALRQDKSPVMIIRFDNGYVATVKIGREDDHGVPE